MAAEVEPQYNKNNPFLARLTENTHLNKAGSAKDTRHLVVSIEGSDLNYTCGDSLGVFPSNSKEAVEAVLKALHASGDESVVLPRTEDEIRLEEALTHKLSLASPTRKSLMAFAERANDEREKSQLRALLKDENQESTAHFLAEREFIDLLEEFPSARFSPQDFVTGLRKLMPRLYSIASSPLVHAQEIHLTVAVVRYETNHRERGGVCSTYLSDRVALNEAILPVFVTKSHFGLPEDASTPIIMVGPGTGIAPFRAFLQERIASRATGKNWLFFGDQHAATDFLYQDEFEGMKAENHIERLDLAWSRDQDEKVYVQHKMLESGAALWEWLDAGASFYVCGDAKRMARDVDAALHQIAGEHGGLSEEEAVAFIKQLKKDKRYQRDVY